MRSIKMKDPLSLGHIKCTKCWEFEPWCKCNKYIEPPEPIKITRTCYHCNGKGQIAKYNPFCMEQCLDCNGKGKIEY